MVDIMCNLSVGIAKAGVDKGYLLGRQDGRIEGRQEGRQEGIRDGVRLGKAENQREVTVRMLENHMPLEIIVRITGQSEDDIKRIAEEESLPC
jgi:predicted transposase/invertase (TIGR01784 family)